MPNSRKLRRGHNTSQKRDILALADRVLDEVTGVLEQPATIFGPKLNIWEFVTHPDWIGEKPTGFQGVLLKYIYRLWKGIPFDDEELRVLDVLSSTWGIDLDLSDDAITSPRKIIVLNAGRRAGKSRLISWINAYGAYELIYMGNPQKEYGLVQEQPIEIWHAAASEDQARDVFVFTRNNIIKCKFFRTYYDGRKQNESELRLFTPQDLRVNAQAVLENKFRDKSLGLPKVPSPDGTILIRSIPTNAFTQRGKSIRTLIFSEFAHLQRAADNVSNEDFVENPRTDEAMWRALVPSTKDYGDDALVIVESTPLEKGGTFYKLYAMGGGIEVDTGSTIERDPNIQTFQLATWEARPSITRESLEDEFQRDNLAAEREYGAHFQNPVSAFLPPELVASIFQPGLVASLAGGPVGNVICVDTAKNSDTYVVGWGYSTEDSSNPGSMIYVIAGFMAFLPQTLEGTLQPVDPVVVSDWITKVLYPALGGHRGGVYEICYDQWNSMEAISRMQRAGMPARETTFTDVYKDAMYTEFFNRTRSSQVRCYTEEINPTDGFITRLRLELSYLRVIKRGKKTLYHAPTSGPVRTDDFADVAANIIYRLVRIVNPTRQSIHKDLQSKMPARGVPNQRVRPVKGGKIWRT